MQTGFMMSASCCDNQPAFEGLSNAYRRVLWLVIAINAIMFVVEMTAGALAGSRALQADALDFLADTLTYGLSLMVIGAAARVRAGAALFKAASLALMGLGVFALTVHQAFQPGVPAAPVMGWVGLAALVANLASVLLLMRYRNGDANVRSVWLCSRNDAIGNVAVIVAAGGVWLTHSAWPDLVVAGLMAALFLRSSAQIVRQAVGEWRDAQPRPHAAEANGRPAARAAER
jgi:cation diffusion facilitator family transporter